MISNDQELDATLERIRHLQNQVAHLRHVETNPADYHLSASGFLAELDRMQLEVREHLSLHPGELKACAVGDSTARAAADSTPASTIPSLVRVEPDLDETQQGEKWLLTSVRVAADCCGP